LFILLYITRPVSRRPVTSLCHVLQILNVFSVDSYRVYMASWTVVYLICVPVYIAIATVYCYTLIGYWCFVAIGTFVFCYYIQARFIIPY